MNTKINERMYYELIGKNSGFEQSSYWTGYNLFNTPLFMTILASARYELSKLSDEKLDRAVGDPNFAPLPTVSMIHILDMVNHVLGSSVTHQVAFIHEMCNCLLADNRSYNTEVNEHLHDVEAFVSLVSAFNADTECVNSSKSYGIMSKMYNKLFAYKIMCKIMSEDLKYLRDKHCYRIDDEYKASNTVTMSIIWDDDTCSKVSVYNYPLYDNHCQQVISYADRCNSINSVSIDGAEVYPEVDYI